jgi:hypothetical protein
MAVTVRTLLNYVLRTVAETEVEASDAMLTSSYQKLVLTFLNQIKEEVEDAHNWRDLYTVHSAALTAGQYTAAITGANERSRLARTNTDYGLVPVVFDITIPTTPLPLIEVPLTQLRYMIAQDPVSTTTAPAYFAIEGNSDGTLDIVVFPKTTGARSLTVAMFTPQDRLDVDDLDVVIKIPTRPLEIGTVWYALMERGEEMGNNSLFTEERWRKALDDAVARDAEEQGGYELQLV